MVMTERREPVVEGFIAAGDRSKVGWYVWLPLIGLTEAQTRRIREQALEVLDRYGSSERATIVHTFQGIVDATEERLGIRKPAHGAATHYLLAIAPDDTDPWAQIRDDRGATVAFALRYADDPDPAIAGIWRAIAEDFDELRFKGRA